LDIPPRQNILNFTFQISKILQNGRYLFSGTFCFIKFLKLKKFIMLRKELFLGLLGFLGPARGNKSRKTLKEFPSPLQNLEHDNKGSQKRA
jgi:hypothetical protein